MLIKKIEVKKEIKIRLLKIVKKRNIANFKITTKQDHNKMRWALQLVLEIHLGLKIELKIERTVA